ncbi:beta-1,3-galactosyltransferase 1-like isoform X2 [Homarus americanus]|nr:beta-1,3-galactosyltransferase 1-like isoform X2 [Homarus americanus]XP_042236034.1 beta-1,3-galactosyltransferase 1-like isoform X2 [Homarus americanus]
MPRKPRLPTLAAYLLLLSLVLLLYVSVRDSEQDSQQQTADPQLGNQGAGEEPSLGARSIKGTKRRGRTKDLPANPHNFHMMINNANVCSGESTVWLLVLVSSAVANFHRRRAIRDTWGGSAPLTASHAKLVFLLANPHDSRQQTQVVEESRTYGDILQEDFVDSYMNLTLKSVMGLKWASTYCQQAHYVMKTDDDMYVNIPSLITYLQESRRSRWITGCIKQKKAFLPVNAVPGLPLPPAHPPFVAGAGYIMSGDIVKDLYSASLNTRIIPVEDVYVTAHLARSIGVHPPVHDNRFTCGEMVNDDCDLVQVFTGHRITPERMYHIWDKLNPNGITSPCFDF